MALGELDIHIENGPASLEYPQAATLMGPIQRLRYQRGPARLVVSMPVPAVLPARAAGVCVALAVTGSVFAVLMLEPFVALPLVALALLLAALGVRSLIRRNLREQLDVDSRFVTVSYNGDYAAILGRRQLADPRVQLEPRSRAESPGFSKRLWPRVIWGERGSLAGGVGAGLSEDEASRVVSAIERFCLENPVDPEFEFEGSYLPGSWARI